MFNAHIRANRLHFPLKKQVRRVEEREREREKAENTDADADTMPMMHSVLLFMRIERI